MLKITGKLISKSIMKTGDNAFGKWRIITFILEKTYNKKKYKMMFVAKGKWADFANDIIPKERVTIHFIVDSKEYAPGKWGTDLQAIEIEKYVSRKTPFVYLNNDLVNKEDFDMNKDLQLNFKNE